MRSISWFVVGFGLIVAPSSAWAQSTPRPAVQVVIGSDGSIKVIDGNTGKEIPSKVIKDSRRPGAKRADEAQRQQADQDRREADEQRRFFDKNRRDADNERRDAEKQLERARQQLERLLREQPQRANPKAKGPEQKPLQFELELGGITFEKAQKPATMEQKLDRLLKQMDELRRDVNQIKARLDGKGPPKWNFKPRPGEPKSETPGEFRFQIVPGAGKKPDGPRFEFKLEGADEEAIRKQVRDLIKKLEGKKALENPMRTPPPASRNAEVEKRLERIMREAEELRREVLKGKSSR